MEPIIYGCLNVVLRDDYTVDSLDYSQEEINWMLNNLDWQVVPAGVGYISLSFLLTCDLE
jgi:hypothetical protein